MANFRIHGFIKFQKGTLFTPPSCFRLGLEFSPAHKSSSSYLAAAFLHSNSCSINNVNTQNPRSIRPLPSVGKFIHFFKIKQYSCSLDFFKRMCALGVPVLNNYTATLVIKCYCRLRQTEHSFTVLGYCFKHGIVPHVSAFNSMLNGFIREDKTHMANILFNKLVFNNNRLLVCEEPGLVVTYNTMIKGLCKIGDNVTAIALLRLMDGRGGSCKPDIVSYNTIIGSLCNHVIMIDDALNLFKEMVFKKAIPPDVLTYNSLIYALSKLGRWDEVYRMLKQMKDEMVSPLRKTFDIIVDALCKQGKTNEANFLIDIMEANRDRYSPGIVTYNSLIDGFCLQGEMSKAETLFNSLTLVDDAKVVTYNKLLTGYCKNYKVDKAFHMYNHLLSTRAEPKPDMVAHDIVVIGQLSRARRTVMAEDAGVPISDKQAQAEFPHKDIYITQLQSYCNKGDYEDALALFNSMDGSKINLDIDVYNVLIDGASKCGKMDTARRLFHDLFVIGLRPDVETYIFMNRGLCQRGLLKDALRVLFNSMRKSGYRLNNVIINDIVEGYLKNRPFRVAQAVADHMSDKGFTISASNTLLVLDQRLAREPDNTILKLISNLIPREREYDEDNIHYTFYEPYGPFGSRNSLEFNGIGIRIPIFN